MKKKKQSKTASTKLDPSHPNYDAILLKQARLEAHRRRRMENSGVFLGQEWKSAAGKPAKKSAPRSKG